MAERYPVGPFIRTLTENTNSKLHPDENTEIVGLLSSLSVKLSVIIMIHKVLATRYTWFKQPMRNYKLILDILTSLKDS